MEGMLILLDRSKSSGVPLVAFAEDYAGDFSFLMFLVHFDHIIFKPMTFDHL